jgi:exodeoxyribonuclease VII small subunit
MATFEENVKQLEATVAKLEQGEVSLEDSITLFEEGMRLSAACKEQLEAAEGKVQILMRQRDGSLQPETFPPLKS